MSFRIVLRAAAIAAVLLAVLAAGGLAALRASVGAADHPAILRALKAADPQDLGVPLIKQHIRGFEAGYFPDCAGIAILAREGRWASPLEAAIRADTILPNGIDEMCARVQAELHGGDSGAWFTYARYWHGSLMLHRLVLSGGGYGDLQDAAAILLGLGLLALLAAAAWRVGFVTALSLVICIALLTDARAVFEMPVQAAGFAALLFAAAGFAAFGAGQSGVRALVVAAMAGGFLNFFDFLYTPAAFAMLNAWFWLAAMRRDDTPRALTGGFWIFAASLGGYGLFWAMKWAAAFAFDPAGREIFIFGANEFTRWGPATGGTWPLEATLTVMGQTFDLWWKGGLAAGIALTALALRLSQRRPSRLGEMALMLTPLVPALAVIEIMAGHTIAHAGFTFRIVPIALGILAASLVRGAYMVPDARKAAISTAP